MSASKEGKDRTRLDGFEIEIIQLVKEQSTSEQWKEWLRAPLEHAAAKGNMDLFTRLMDAGADGSAGWRGCLGRTLLGAAAYGKNEKMVHALLGAGAKDDVNVAFNGVQHETALHVASARGAEGASNALMLAGADPNLQNGRKGETPLDLAAAAGHHVIVNNLLLKGADPNAMAPMLGYTALHFAARGGHALCVSNLLLGGADKDTRNNSGETPLFLAASLNYLGVVEVLLAAGANPNTLDIWGTSALFVAVFRGHVSVVKGLLRHGADVGAVDADEGVTALHYAFEAEVLYDDGDVIRVLLEAGADIKAKTTEEGRTPLHLAAALTYLIPSTRALLEGGADVNARDKAAQTPLHRACHYSSVGIVELLLQWGADETLADEDGNTAKEVVGAWEADANDDYDDGGDKQRIHQMLAHAPADRCWRRRGWLVLCRSYPTKVQVTKHSNRGRRKVAKASPDGSGGDADQIRDEMGGVTTLVGRVIGLDVEGVFRLVVGFL